MSDLEKQSEVFVPVKRNEGKTLKDRMNSNAYHNLMTARYTGRNPDGSEESQEDVFPRVARNVSLPEIYYELENSETNIHITPKYIKDTHSKPEELESEMGFTEKTGYTEDGVPTDDESETAKVKLLEESDLQNLSYEKLISHPELLEEVIEHAESVRDDFENLMSNLNYMPNTPTIMNAGQELQMLSACFVISPEDSMENIHDTLKKSSLIMQAGGGMGYGFWKLRPYGDQVGNDEGISSGPISFMKEFDSMCNQIAQGRTRRGAQMGVMRISHPDVLYFIHSKNKDVSLTHSLLLNDKDDFTHNSFGEALEEARGLIDDQGRVPEHLRNAVEGHLSNFNISVGVTDRFMECLENGEDYTFINPQTNEPHIVHEYTKEMLGWFGLDDYVTIGEEMSLPAEVVWNRIIEGSHENGEPGIVYLERMNKDHSFDVEEHPDYRINSTNPCGEQELSEYEACNLAHINLSTLTDTDAKYRDYRKFREIYRSQHDVEDESEIIDRFLEDAIDWTELNRRIRIGTRFLDNVVTVSDFPVDEVTERVRSMRKIGLGIMGLAQLYVQLGVRYGSEEGNLIAEKLMAHINHKSKDISQELAGQRGVFEDWSKSKYQSPSEYPEWFEKQTGEDPEQWSDGFPVRNHCTTTIAPTGSTSMLGNTTGGCEPMYNVAYFKNVTEDVQGDEMLVEFDDYFLRVLEANDIDVEAVKKEAEELMNSDRFTGVEDLRTVPDEIGELFVTTQELTGKEHASVQCALQKGVDASISKTVNFPESATKEEMDQVFRYIYNNGGKGVTAYRDGTRSKQVLTTRKNNTTFAEDDVDEEELIDVVEQNISDDWFRQELAEILMQTADEELTPEEFAEELGMGVVGDNEELVPEPRERGKVLYGTTEKIKTGYGTIYVTINEDETGLVEVFTQIGKSGGFMNSFTESVSRLISVGLRSGIPPEDIIDHLEDIRSPKIAWDEGDKVHSIPDAIATAMERYLDSSVRKEAIEMQETELETVSSSDTNGHMTKEEEKDESNSAQKSVIESGENPECPDCGSFTLYYSEGCKTCEECGWSEC